jgi:predicted HicB family RNase H-like nuclease
MKIFSAAQSLLPFAAGCRTMDKIGRNSMSDTLSTARLEARINPELHRMLKRAAELQGSTVTCVMIQAKCHCARVRGITARRIPIAPRIA